MNSQQLEGYKFRSKPLDLDLFRAMSADLIAKASSKFGGATVTGATSDNGNLARDLNAVLPNSETRLCSLKFTERFLHAHSSNTVY
jgi:hypothetical protein